MEDTLQINERPLTGARIRGIPTYRLTGVTDANRDLVKSTQMWVHHPHLGDEGWYLAVPDAWYDAAAQGLGEYGLGLEYLGRLPKRSNILFGIGLTLGVIAAFAVGYLVGNVEGGNSGVGGFIALATPFMAIALISHRARSTEQYGALITPESGDRKATNWPDRDPFMDDWGMAAANIPGSLAYNMWHRDRTWD